MLTKQEYEDKAKELVDAFRAFWAASEHALCPAEKLKGVLIRFLEESLITFISWRENSFLLRRLLSGDPIFLDPQGREVTFLDLRFCRHCYRVLSDPRAQILQTIDPAL